MKPSEIVTKAIDLIEKHGWTRGSYQDSDTGCLCLVGALRLAAGETILFPGKSVTDTRQPEGPHHAAFEEAYWSLTSHLPHSLPVVWNDQYAKDVEQVIDVLHKTAVDLAAAGK